MRRDGMDALSVELLALFNGKGSVCCQPAEPVLAEASRQPRRRGPGTQEQLAGEQEGRMVFLQERLSLFLCLLQR